MSISHKIKVVLDTSVIISANYKSRGDSLSSRVWQALIDNEFILIISPQIFREIVVSSKKLKDFPKEKIIKMIQLINSNSVKISGEYNTDYLDDIDPKDNMFLAAAYEANADYLVSIDKKHLLPIKYFYGTQILEPELFLRRLDEVLNTP